MGLIGLIVASYGGLWGVLTGLAKSTDHPSMVVPSKVVFYLLPDGCALWAPTQVPQVLMDLEP